jgi:hypothetical protein
VNCFSKSYQRFPCAATAAMKGISILGWKETESSYSIDLVTLAWDQRLLQWEVNRKKEHTMKDEEECEETKFFQVERSLLSSLRSQSAYQNQFEYYYRSASLFQSDESLSLTNSKNTVNQQNIISIQFKNGIVVYISEIASLFTLKTTKPDKEESSQQRNWLCSVVGEGFQILQINK